MPAIREFDEFVKMHGADPDALDVRQRTAWQAAWRAEQPETDQETGLPIAKTAAEEADAKLALIRAGQTRQSLRFSQPARHRDSDAIEAGLMLSLGIPSAQVEKQHDEQTMQVSRDRGYHRHGLQSLMRLQLEGAGYHPPGGRLGESDIKHAMRLDAGHDAWQGTSPSTISVSGILSNVANKSALAAFTTTPQTFRSFTKRMSVRDFKDHTAYRLTSNLEFEEVAPSGELKHGTLGEESTTVKAKTYGKLLGLSRKDMINDDLSLFATLPTAIGRAGATGLEKAAYTLLLENSAGGTNDFFGSAHGNYVGDTALAVLNLAGLGNAEGVFLGLLDSNGDPALVAPEVLLVAPAQANVARQLVAPNSQLIDGTTTAQVPNANPFSGRFAVVVAPWLAPAVGLSANALGTRWYLLTGANDFAILVAGFLDGKEQPTIESAEFDFDRLGMSWRGYFDWGFSMHDYRGGFMSNGEAS